MQVTLNIRELWFGIPSKNKWTYGLLRGDVEVRVQVVEVDGQSAFFQRDLVVDVADVEGIQFFVFEPHRLDLVDVQLLVELEEIVEHLQAVVVLHPLRKHLLLLLLDVALVVQRQELPRVQVVMLFLRFTFSKMYRSISPSSCRLFITSRLMFRDRTIFLSLSWIFFFW